MSQFVTPLRRIGVPPFSQSQEPEVTPMDLIGPDAGEFLSYDEVPEAWIFNLVRSARGAYPKPQGSTIVTSWDDVDMCIDKLSALRDVAARSGSALGEASADHLKRAVLERGRGGMWHIQVGGMKTTGHQVPARVFERLKAVLPPSRDPGLDLSRPRHTNHGWPCLSTSDLSLIAHSAVAASSPVFEEFYDNLQEFGAILGNNLRPCAYLFTRTGPFAKPTRTWSQEGGRFVSRSSSIGAFCRTRLVYGHSNAYNGYTTGPALDMKDRLTRRSGHRSLELAFLHLGAQHDRTSLLELIARAKAYWQGRDPDASIELMEQDFSGFDTTVDRAWQDAMATILYDDIFAEWGLSGNNGPATAYRFQSTFPVLAPPMRPGDAGFLYHRDGQTMSGSIFTTTDGCLIGFASAVAAVAAGYGISVDASFDMFMEGGWGLLAWGDDILLVLNFNGFDLAAYEAAIAATGLVAKIVRGNTFLMVWHGATASFNLAARAAMKTLFRENGTSDRDIELLGFFSRFDAAIGDPMWKTALSMTVGGTWLEPWAHDWSYLRQRVMSADFAARIQRYLKKDPTYGTRLLLSLTRGTGNSALLPPHMAAILGAVKATVSPEHIGSLVPLPPGVAAGDWRAIARLLRYDENPLRV